MRCAQRIATLEGRLIPADVTATVTRDYGETANEKANELLFHLGLATVSIVVLIALAIGWREAVVTLVVIPTTILLTLFAANIMGYTINRVSLFALIFSIGILVDDAIVVVENIARHWAMKDGRSRLQAAIEAVAEVGNPTILATLTVVAALLPMLFVSGLMGPYMAPIPANASAAMLFSFFVAMVIAPWLMLKLHREGSAVAAACRRAWRGLARPALSPGRRAGDSHAPLGLDLPARRRRRDAAGDGAVLHQERDGEAAAVRQQVGDRRRRRPAGRRKPRRYRARAAGGGRHCPRVAGGDLDPDLCRHRGAVQFQRPGAALLFARGAGARRTAGQPDRPRRPRARQPRDRARAARKAERPRARRRALRSRWWRCRRGRRCWRRLLAEIYGPDSSDPPRRDERDEEDLCLGAVHRRRRRFRRRSRGRGCGCRSTRTGSNSSASSRRTSTTPSRCCSAA